MTNFLEKPTSAATNQIISLVALIIFLPFFILVAYRTVELVTKATGIEVSEIVVDTQSVLEPITPDFYHAFAQGGEEADDMLAPVADEIRKLKPKLIRLDHIYDHYDVVSRAGNGLAFNWSKLDAAVNTITAVGAKPVLALSFMPPAIAKDGSLINPPNNWEDWSAVVQATIEHYSGHNNKNISGVYYEVWNEPDLAQFGAWKMYGDKSYVALYRASAAGAARASNVNRFFLGGPSTTGLYKNWLIGLIQTGLRVDFLSWHSYLPDPGRFYDDQKNITQWLLPYPKYTLIPKLITEFGHTGAKDRGYGTTYGAAHAVAAIRQVITGNPTYMFTFQLKDGPGQTGGDGWGLIGHETDGKKIKPRYHIFNFLDQMTGNRVKVSGEGTWITGFASTKDGVYRLLLVHFGKNGSQKKPFNITFANLPPGNYTYRERLLFGRDVTFNQTVTQDKLTRNLLLPLTNIALIEVARIP